MQNTICVLLHPYQRLNAPHRFIYSRLMNMNPEQVRVAGLDKLDARRMEAELSDGVTFEEEELTSDKAGEPVTVIAVISLTALGLKTLGQWLMRQRQHDVLEYTVEIEHANGDREKRVVKLDRSSSTPGSAEVIKAVGESLTLDPSLVTAATDLLGGQ